MYADSTPAPRYLARSLAAQMGTRRLADALHVSRRTVQRWITTAAQRRRPSAARIAAMLALRGRSPRHACPAKQSASRLLRVCFARAKQSASRLVHAWFRVTDRAVTALAIRRERAAVRERRLREMEADLARQQARLDALFAGLAATYRAAGLPVPDQMRMAHLSVLTS